LYRIPGGNALGSWVNGLTKTCAGLASAPVGKSNANHSLPVNPTITCPPLDVISLLIGSTEDKGMVVVGTFTGVGSDSGMATGLANVVDGGGGSGLLNVVDWLPVAKL
jgi:hypothetical protein